MALSQNLHCCFYPTHVVFIDDDYKYLQNLVLILDTNIEFKLFHKLKDIEKLLETVNVVEPIINPNKSAEDLEMEISSSHYNISKIHQKISDQKRFQQFTVVILDYAMPRQTGVELAKQIKNPFISKILLTGKAEKDDVIEAFNHKLIDGYLNKDDPDFAQKLNTLLHQQQHAYFYRASELIINSLPESTFIHDPVLVELINTLIRDNQIVEYYLIDVYGSYLMVNQQGQVSWLIVQDEQIMTMYQTLASDGDAPKEVMTGLERHEKLLFLYGQKETINTAPAQWGQFMYPAKHLKGKKQYYYAYIDNVKNALHHELSPYFYSDFLRES